MSEPSSPAGSHPGAHPDDASPADTANPDAPPGSLPDRLPDSLRDTELDSVMRDRSTAELCEAAAQQVATTLPNPWARAWLQVETTDGIALIYCWYQPAAGAPPRYHDLPPEALDQLCQIFRALRRVTTATGDAAWNEAALTLDAVEGTYTVDYDQVDPAVVGSPAAQLDRHMAWQQRHLAQAS